MKGISDRAKESSWQATIFKGWRFSEKQGAVEGDILLICTAGVPLLAHFAWDYIESRQRSLALAAFASYAHWMTEAHL